MLSHHQVMSVPAAPANAPLQTAWCRARKCGSVSGFQPFQSVPYSLTKKGFWYLSKKCAVLPEGGVMSISSDINWASNGLVVAGSPVTAISTRSNTSGFVGGNYSSSRVSAAWAKVAAKKALEMSREIAFLRVIQIILCAPSAANDVTAPRAPPPDLLFGSRLLPEPRASLA